MLASICGHPITGAPKDYCRLCSDGDRLRSERSHAISDFNNSRQRFNRGSIDHDSFRDSRRRLDSARMGFANWESRYEDENERRSRETGELNFNDRLYSPRVRFYEPEPFRRESQYRSQPLYRRESPRYQSGLHADTSGLGYEDTSFRYQPWSALDRPPSPPPAPRRRNSGSPRRSSTVYREREAPRRSSNLRRSSYDDDLSQFSTTELKEQRERLLRALSRYR